jgi:Cytochrome c7 and related cytochrome c
MTQIFSSAADGWMRLFLVATAAIVSGGTAAAIAFARSDYYTGARIHPPPQPVPFSHQHHVAGLGIDCRYCHSHVADGPRAGLPPTHTCMTCHSQIWTGAPMLAPVRRSLADNTSLVWHRVARLPQYVYFRHDIHVAKGVGCVSCHGRVDRMPLTVKAAPFTMDFCLDCHRDPAPHLRPPDRITDMRWQPSDHPEAAGSDLVKQYGIRVGELTYCYMCHR